jgi:RimJ/RimL family protein N-acetyltransferase
VRLRRAVVGDLPELVAVQQAGAIAALSNIFPQELYPFPRDRVLARWAEELTDRQTQVFVSTDDSGGITGFAAVSVDELLHFGTAVETWGTGLATELHDALLAAFPTGTGRARLRVYTENRRARRFYEKLGWSATGQVSRSTFPPHAELLEYALELRTN